MKRHYARIIMATVVVIFWIVTVVSFAQAQYTGTNPYGTEGDYSDRTVEGTGDYDRSDIITNGPVMCVVNGAMVICY